jgi:hypothetical protein
MFWYLDVVHVIWGHIRKITNFSMMCIYIRILLNIVNEIYLQGCNVKFIMRCLYITNKQKKNFVHCKHWNSFSYQKPNLGPLCCNALLIMINWWKNQIDFVKIKFHPNEFIKWNCIQFELISNSTIGLKLNWIEKNEMKLVENLLKIFLWRWCWKRDVTLLPN